MLLTEVFLLLGSVCHESTATFPISFLIHAKHQPFQLLKTLPEYPAKIGNVRSLFHKVRRWKNFALLGTCRVDTSDSHPGCGIEGTIVSNGSEGELQKYGLSSRVTRFAPERCQRFVGSFSFICFFVVLFFRIYLHGKEAFVLFIWFDQIP